MTVETLRDAAQSHPHRGTRAGVVVVFAAGRPACMPFPFDGRALSFGRGAIEDVSLEDLRMSRKHAEVACTPEGWLVRDSGSRNGTFADGQLVAGYQLFKNPPVIRLGHTVAIAVNDILPFLAALPMRDKGIVGGPAWSSVMKQIAVAAASDADLLVTGETGCGKELAAAHFHASGARARGPLVVVNCAAIPHGIAERLLFGATKGAYSGASTEARGYVQAAAGGVLFLDEFGELDLDVQAKLLRVIETKEALTLGASRGQKVDMQFCLATHRDLRAAVATGKFRADLYYRVSHSAVALAPLRERREEIPWLIELAVETAAAGLSIDAELVEACLLRPWPGNVRELLGEIKRIARIAQTRSQESLHPGLLGPEAHGPAPQAHKASRTPVTAEQVQRALREASTVSAAARSLCIHRSHLYRLIREFGIDTGTRSPKPN